LKADFRQFNTTAKTGAICGRPLDAQTPLNIGENRRSIALAEICDFNTTVFFLVVIAR